MKAIVINATGGPEPLEFQEQIVRMPSPGEVLVDVVVAGVNFMDVGVRIGHRYPLAQAAQANSDIESRRTPGKLLLLP